MRPAARTAVAVLTAAMSVGGAPAQETTRLPPAEMPAQETTSPSIDWAKSFDEAMRAMGANERPVILYFTYDT